MQTADLSLIEDLRAQYPQNISLHCFDADYVQSLAPEDRDHFLFCLRSGLQHPSSEMGCYAGHPADYDRFEPFFAQAVSRYHHVDPGAAHQSNWHLKEGHQFDLSELGLPPLSMRVRVGRNLLGVPLPSCMAREDRLALEANMQTVFAALIADPAFGGTYHSLTPGHPNALTPDQYTQMVAQHLIFKNMAQDEFLNISGIADDWPYGRGCYVSANRSVIIWVGEEDHLRIMCMETGSKLTSVFQRLKNTLEIMTDRLNIPFAHSPKWGFITSCPTNLGTAMRASVHLRLPNLCAKSGISGIKEKARPLGLAVRGLGGEHTPIGKDGTVDLSPSARFCIAEAEILAKLYDGIKALKQADEDV